MQTVPQRGWSAEFRAAAKLAWPLALSQVGHHLLGFTDTFLAGKVDATTLGAVAVGNTVFFAIAVTGMGVMMGLDALVSQSLGANRSRAGRRALWQGVYLALGLTVPLSLVMWAFARSLPELGVVAELTGDTASYIYARIPSVAPSMLMIACRSYLQSSQVARPVVWSTVIANLFNAIADLLVLFGDDALIAIGLPAVGLPKLGAFGVGLASTVATFAQAAVLGLAIRYLPVGSGPRSFRRFDPALIWRVVSVGGPVSLQLFAEVFIFSMTGVLMGSMGTDVAAAHQVALTYASLSFAICVGVGAAAAALVGRAVGANEASAARRAGVATGTIAVGIMTVSALVLVLAGEPLSRFIIDREQVVPLAIELLVIAAFFQLADGIQAVAAGALRGAGITRFSLVANLVGHWLVGIPVGLLLAYPLGLGPVGLWWGLTAGLSVVAVALALKFWFVTSGPMTMAIDPISDD